MKRALLRMLVMQLLGPPLAALLLLTGLIALGRAARAELREQDRYTLPLADVTCEAPPGEERSRFLGEVQYLGGLPDRLPLLDDDLPGRLTAAFAQHPWVEKVERVEVAPPRHVAVRLAYRTPVLAVLLSGPPPDGQAPMIESRSSPLGGHNALAPARAVDRTGTLLPATASMQGLPILYGPVAPPSGPAGTVWADPAVAAAARTAEYLRPYQGRLRLEDMEVKDGVLVLSAPPDARVRWGHAPGAEAEDEAPASEKVERLLRYCQEHGRLDQPEPLEHDVRPKGQATHRRLPKT